MKTGIEEVLTDLSNQMRRVELTYGAYESTHEALGVIVEEYHELVEAIRKGASESIRMEAIDLAVAAVRLANHCRGFASFSSRSGFND